MGAAKRMYGGERLQDIAADLRVTPGTLYRAVTAHAPHLERCRLAGSVLCRILAMHDLDHTNMQIHTLTGLSPTTIRHWLRECGRASKYRGPEPLLDERQMEEVAARLRAGESAQKIADLFGVSKGTVTYHAPADVAAAIATRDPARLERMQELRAQGLSFQQVGDQVGLSGAAVRYHLRNAQRRAAAGEESS